LTQLYVKLPLGTTTKYKVTAELDKCDIMKLLQVTVVSPPTLTKMNDTAICEGESIELKAASPSKNDTITYYPNKYVTPKISTTYLVKSHNSGCAIFDSVRVTVHNATEDSIVLKGYNEVTVNGEMFTKSGVYTQRLLSKVTGCDSVILTIKLTIYQTIDSIADIECTYGDTSFVLPKLLTSKDLEVSYRIPDPDNDVISLDTNNRVDILRAGEVTLAAYNRGTRSYRGALRTFKVIVNKAAQVIDSIPNVRKYADEQSFTLFGTSSSNLPVSFEVSEGNDIIRINGNEASIEGAAGTAVVTAVQTGDRNYMPAKYRFVVEVADVSPKITAHPLPYSYAVGNDYCLSVAASGTNVRYRWYCNGKPVPGAADKDYCIHNLNVDNVGMYFAVASNSAGSDTSTNAALTAHNAPEALSVAEALSRTKAYPNPTQGIITIENENVVVEEVTIHDCSGNTIHSADEKGSVIQLDISNVPSGLYFLNIKTDKGSVTKRIMKVY